MIARTPDNLLQVEYNGIAINPGDVLSKNQVVQKPEIRWRPINESALYTLYLVNPDVPSRFEPYEAEWQHWTVHNIPGIQKASGYEDWIDSGDTVVEYSPEYQHSDSEGSREQCGNIMVFLSLRFYVKSNLVIIQVQNLPFRGSEF